MSEATASHVPLVARVPRVRRATITLPRPRAFGAPVLMSDAVTPLAGETVLSLLWQRMARDDADRGPD